MATKRKKTLLAKFLKICIIILVIGVAILAFFVYLVMIGWFGDLPNQKELSIIQNNLSTEIYSQDGKVIGTFYLQERTKISLEDISEPIKNALVATEDARFYEHGGIDYFSMIRVVVKSLVLRQNSGGGSTITQQLAKNIYPREIHGMLTLPIAKIKEHVIAKRLEQTFSKDELLLIYLNTVPFGDNVFGIEIASKRFYNKSANAIALEEAAVLVGMLKANYTYNPRIFPDNALARRNTVLAQMYKYHFIEKEVYQKTIKKPLILQYTKGSENTQVANYFNEQVKKEIKEWIKSHPKPDGSHYNIYTDGLKIHTTLDSRIQKYAEQAVKSQMKSLQATFDQHWASSKPWTNEPDIFLSSLRKLPKYKQLKKDGLTEKQIIASMGDKHRVQLFSWDGMIERDMTTIDSIKYYLSILQVGVIALDPKTGAVKAWIGGNHFDYFKFDHAESTTKRQVGSTFKPIVYASALEQGLDPCDYISGARTVYSDYENWTPDNADTTENTLKYSFKGALAKSVNTVSVKIMETSGINHTIDMAKKMGINSDIPFVPSIALGTPSISLYEMTQAYSSFANNGLLSHPIMVTRIEDNVGNVLAKFNNNPPERIMSKSTALMMTEMLREVVDNGTGSRIRWKYELKNQIAGKTGTTQSNADGWFIGFNTSLVVGVWVGADDPRVRFRTTNFGSGANMALPIFAKTFQEINKDTQLSKISRATFEPLSAELAELMDCQNSMEDKTFLQNLFGIEKEEQVDEKEFGDDVNENEEQKKGLFEKIGNLFGKKKKKKE